MAFGRGNIGSDLSEFLGGFFGDSSDPFKDAMKQYEEWANKAQGVQNPFLKMGTAAIPQFRQWLAHMKDPSGFINQLMGGYQESPFAKYEQEQAMRAAQNLGSVGDTSAGGAGSTPLTQFAQQNARNISSQDLNQWLQNVLGVNTQYGAGLEGQISGGQSAANALTGMYGDMGRQMGAAAYGQRRGEGMDRANMWGGLFNLGTDVASLFL